MQIDKTVDISFNEFHQLHNLIALKFLGKSLEIDLNRDINKLKKAFGDDRIAKIYKNHDTEIDTKFIRLDGFYNGKRNSLDNVFAKDERVKAFSKLHFAVYSRIYRRRKERRISNIGNKLKKIKSHFLDLRKNRPIPKHPYKNFDIFYLYCFCIFIEPDDFEVNRENIKKLQDSWNFFKGEKTTTDQELPDAENNHDFEKYSFENDQIGTHYRAFYYSFRKNLVKSFDLKIFYDVRPNFNVENQEFYVIERDYHDDSRRPIYQGYAYRLLDLKLYIVSKREMKKIRLKLF